MIHDISGLSSQTWSAPYARVSASSRTSPTILTLDSTTSPETYKQWATTLRRACLLRRRQGLRTRESGCLSWPTATAAVSNDGESLESWEARKARNLEKHVNGNGMGTPLTIASRQWPIASARDWKSGDASPETMDRNARPLNEAATHWPTPRSSPNENRNTQSAPSHGLTHGKTLSGEAISFPPPPPTSTPGPTSLNRILALLRPSVRRRLNPRFVEWLMGWPIGWSDYRAVETDAFHSWRRTHTAALVRILQQRQSEEEAA
jgi:hypothetical protein